MIKQYGQEYLGTDPVKDAIRLERQHLMKLQYIREKGAGGRGHHELVLEQNKLKSNQSKYDPFLNYGFGIKAYFWTMEYLIKVFFLLSLGIALPLMKIYYDGGAYNEIDNLIMPLKMGNYMSPTSLGNLGHAATKCYHQYSSNS